MSRDDYFEQQATYALTGIEIPDGKMFARLRYQIVHMLKEVERDTRHAAAEEIGACQQRVTNLKLTFPSRVKSA